MTTDLLPSSFGVFSHECNYTLSDISIIHKPSFIHTDSNPVDFPLSKSRYLLLLNSVCLQWLVYQLDIWAINQILCKCKHSVCHHVLYLVLLNKNSAQVSWKSFWLFPSFVYTKQNTFFHLHFSKAYDIYTHMHDRGCGIRKRQGLGRDRETSPTCMWKHTPPLPDWQAWEEEVIM